MSPIAARCFTAFVTYTTPASRSISDHSNARCSPWRRPVVAAKRARSAHTSGICAIIVSITAGWIRCALPVSWLLLPLALTPSAGLLLRQPESIAKSSITRTLPRIFFTVLIERPAFSWSISCKRTWPVVRSRTLAFASALLFSFRSMKVWLCRRFSMKLDRVTSPSSWARSTCATK